MGMTLPPRGLAHDRVWGIRARGGPRAMWDQGQADVRTVVFRDEPGDRQY